MAKRSGTTRITIDVTEDFQTMLEELVELADAPSKATVIRDALQVYEFLVERAVNGARFYAVEEDGSRVEIPIFVLSPVRRKGKKKARAVAQ